MDFFFMFIGFGFFLFVINIVQNSEKDAYNRKLNEAREFGWPESRLKKEAENPRKK